MNGFALAAILVMLYALLAALTPLDVLAGEDCVVTIGTEQIDMRRGSGDARTETDTTVCSPSKAPAAAICASFALASLLLLPEILTRLPGVKVSGMGVSAEMPSSPETAAGRRRDCDLAGETLRELLGAGVQRVECQLFGANARPPVTDGSSLDRPGITVRPIEFFERRQERRMPPRQFRRALGGVQKCCRLGTDAVDRADATPFRPDGREAQLREGIVSVAGMIDSPTHVDGESQV